MPQEREQPRREVDAAPGDVVAGGRGSGITKDGLPGGDALDAVGLVKSNVLRYFGTREEIYLQLTMRNGTEWADAVTSGPRDAAGVDQMAGVLADSFARRPLYCDLISHAETMLEHNVSLDELHTCKRWAIGTYARVGGQVARSGHELTEDASVLFAAGGVRRQAPPGHPPPAAPAELFARKPEIAAVFPPFGPALRHFVAATATGLPAVRGESAHGLSQH
ncbi:TetR/AcrR family transcriptional regulator [Lentzea sp. NPDC055074]